MTKTHQNITCLKHTGNTNNTRCSKVHGFKEHDTLSEPRI